MGYYAEQMTQPQTLGYGLADSPVGLLSWIYEKLVNWTDNYPWDDDEVSNCFFFLLPQRLTIQQVLTWVSIYWFSRAGPAASLRIYYESNKNGSDHQSKPTTIPLGYSYFPKDIVCLPLRYAVIQIRLLLFDF